MTRTNLATDPRGTGTAVFDLAAFTESPGDALAGFATSRRFTKGGFEHGTTVLENLILNPGAEVSLAYWNALSGATMDRVTTEHRTGTASGAFTCPGATANEGAAIIRSLPDMVGRTFQGAGWVKAPAGMALYCATRASGTTAIDSAPLDFTGTGDWQFIVANPRIGAQADATNVQFLVRTKLARAGVFYLDDVIIAEGAVDHAFTGSTLDQAPTDTALGWDYAWTGPPNASTSTATSIDQYRIAVPVPLPAGHDVTIRAQVRASQAIPGGRLTLRPDLTTPTGETPAVQDLSLPEGVSTLTYTGPSGATGSAGFALVWGGQAPAGMALELTGWQIEVDPPAGATDYFDGWTADVPATATAPGIDHAWTGPPNASTSTSTPTPAVPNLTRQAFAAALSTVEGITGFPSAPRTLGRGQGWPVWQARTPLTLASDEVRWLVHVTLPAGLPDATVLEAEALTDWVLAALSEVGVVEQIEPDALISTQDRGQPVPALTVTMTTTT